MANPSPASPAGITQNKGTETEPHLPKAPGPETLLSIFGTGAVTGLAAAGLSVCILSNWLFAFPHRGDIIATVVFGVPLWALLMVFVRRYFMAFRRTDRRSDRWIWLSLPFFLTAGAALGYAFLTTAGGGAKPRPRLDESVCESSEVRGECLVRSAHCQLRLLADGTILPPTFGDLVACAKP